MSGGVADGVTLASSMRFWFILEWDGPVRVIIHGLRFPSIR